MKICRFIFDAFSGCYPEYSKWNNKKLWTTAHFHEIIFKVLYSFELHGNQNAREVHTPQFYE